MLPANPKAVDQLASGKFMQSFRVYSALVVVVALCTQSATAQSGLGAQGAETGPSRMQQWLVPTPTADRAAHALLFRPPNHALWNLDITPDGRRFLVLTAPASRSEETNTVHATILLNFFDELRHRLPSN